MSRHKPVPNAFVSIRINSPIIKENMKKVQQEMVVRDSRLKPLMVSLDKLHLTLMVMQLKNKEEEERAKHILCEVTNDVTKKFSLDMDPMDIVVAEIGNFSNSVVFAKIVDGATKQKLVDIADVVRTKFGQEGLPTTDSRPFQPHLTIAKTSRSSRLRSIPSSSYADLRDTHFGDEKASGLELLSMSEPVDEQGYYHSFQKCPF